MQRHKKPMSILYAVQNIFVRIQASIITWLNPHSWASKKANKLIKKSSVREKGWLWKSIGDQWDGWMHPEHWRVSLFLSGVIIFISYPLFATGLYHLLEKPRFILVDQPTEIIGTSLQILAAVIGIAFVIVVFLTQYVHERDYERRAFPLFVSQTWMIFTVMFGLLTLASMSINFFLLKNPNIEKGFQLGITYYNMLLFLVNIGLTIRLYVRTYLFLTPSYFQEQFLRYNQKRVAESVHRELLRRISQNIILQAYRDNGFEFSFIDKYPEKHPVELPGLKSPIAEVSDVNLVILRTVGKRIEQIVEVQDNKPILFLVNIGSRLSSESPRIAFVSPYLDLPRITHLIQRCVRVFPLAVQRRHGFEDELLLNRDLISIAINSGRANDVENLLDIYQETLRAFLLAIKTFGFRFSPEVADKETGFFSDWSVVSTILDQYYGLLDDALKSENSEIVFHFVGFPFHIMTLAFSHRDHLIYRRFSNLYPVIYRKAKRNLSDPKLNEYVYDRCGRLLIEFDKYFMSPLFENEQTPEVSLPVIADYSAHLLVVINQLLKATIDFRESERFRRFAGVARAIFQEARKDSHVHHLETLKIRISWLQEGQARAELQKEYDRALAIKMQSDRIRTLRGILFLGLGAWISHLLETQKITPSEFQEYNEAISIEFLDIPDLYWVFCMDFSDGDFSHLFNWSSWEMDEWPESIGEVKSGWMQFSDWVERYYTFRALTLSPIDPKSIPELSPNPNSQRVLEILEKQHTLLSGNQAWKPIIKSDGGKDLQKQFTSLSRMHQLAVEKQAVIDETIVSQQPLDPKLIQNFRHELMRAWEESSTLRKLITLYGRFEARPNAEIPEGLQQFGIQQVADKRAFIQQTKIAFIDFGTNYGRGLAKSEDQLLISQIAHSKRAIKADLTDFDEIIRQYLGEMRTKGMKPIILHSGLPVFTAFRKSQAFEPIWKLSQSLPDVIGIKGCYDGALVVSSHELQPENSVVLVDLSIIGVLAQYPPDGNDQFPLSLTIEEFSKAQAEKILSDNPDWSKDSKTSKFISREAAIRRIQQYVGIQVWERVCLEDINDESLVIISFGGDNKEAG
jgi:hypothetical protein